MEDLFASRAVPPLRGWPSGGARDDARAAVAASTVATSSAKRTSTAVMARRAEPADSLDFFPTPPWATRAFCEHVMRPLWGDWPDIFACSVLDPACGEGHMALPLAGYFETVLAADIFDYGFGAVADFLHPHQPPELAAPDWIVTNPPFNRAAEFVETALKRARRGVAILARAQFAEGQARHRAIFRDRPPQLTANFVERVPMHKGRWVINGKSATAYKWFCWLKHPPHDWRHSREIWIPPCRQALTRPDDWLVFGGSVELPAGHAVRRLLASRAALEEAS